MDWSTAWQITTEIKEIIGSKRGKKLSLKRMGRIANHLRERDGKVFNSFSQSWGNEPDGLEGLTLDELTVLKKIIRHPEKIQVTCIQGTEENPT